MLGEVCRAYLVMASDDDNGEIPWAERGVDIRCKVCSERLLHIEFFTWSR